MPQSIRTHPIQIDMYASGNPRRASLVHLAPVLILPLIGVGWGLVLYRFLLHNNRFSTLTRRQMTAAYKFHLALVVYFLLFYLFFGIILVAFASAHRFRQSAPILITSFIAAVSALYGFSLFMSVRATFRTWHRKEPPYPTRLPLTRYP